MVNVIAKIVQKGLKAMKINRSELEKIVKMTQMELKGYVVEELKQNGYDVAVGDGYVYAKGTEPYLLTAHLDTVHEKKRGMPKQINYEKKNGKTIMSSPQGIGADDRGGVYAVLELMRDFHATILFCEDEEIGSKGAAKFVNTEHIFDLCDLNYLIQIDRRGSHDAVFYECGNKEFQKFIEDNTDFVKAYGSWTDICELSPECDVASVNFSTGYYDEHTVQETLVLEELEHTIEQVRHLLCVECKPFDYQERKAYGNLFDYYEDDYDIFGVSYKEDDDITYDEAEGESLEVAMLHFLIEHPTVCWNDIINLEKY